MAAHPSDGAAPAMPSTVLLWLQLLALGVGALQFAFAPASVDRPLLAASALATLTASVLLVRLLPALRRSPVRQHWIDIVASSTCITALAYATGAARSAMLPLYLIPLAGVAVAFARWWLVLLFACAIAALVFVLGATTPDLRIGSPDFGVFLVSALAPGTAVALLLAWLIERMHSAVQRISDLASSDPLTGLLNLRAFEQVLQQEHRKAERFGRSYALLTIDVDNLAQTNQTLGHEAGNQILRAVADALSRSIRGSDVAARLGGDEFVVLLMEADASTGAAIAQRIRNNVYAGTVNVANRLVRANVSVGLAAFPDDHLYPKELLILSGQRMQEDRELRRAPAT
jgi:diguanylate cyclase (GGDEF)-like protein